MGGWAVGCLVEERVVGSFRRVPRHLLSEACNLVAAQVSAAIGRRKLDTLLGLGIYTICGECVLYLIPDNHRDLLRLSVSVSFGFCGAF